MPESQRPCHDVYMMRIPSKRARRGFRTNAGNQHDTANIDSAVRLGEGTAEGNQGPVVSCIARWYGPAGACIDVGLPPPRGSMSGNDDTSWNDGHAGRGIANVVSCRGS